MIKKMTAVQKYFKNHIFFIDLKAIFRQFEDEVLDVALSLNGQYVAGCSADGESKIFHVASKREIGDMEGHLDAEISKIQFSPNGNRVITTSADKTLK